MAWASLVQLYREAGVDHGTTYWEYDEDTTELNDDYTKHITIQFNGQTLYVSKSAVFDMGVYGGAVILVVKDTPNSGYIRERLIHSKPQYDYSILLTPNYTENGLKVYIKSLTLEYLSNVEIPVTGGICSSQSITNISIYTDRIERVYSYADYMALMTPQYNWQSVPSIGGKNGILSLAQIKDDYINDGESVSGVSADHFTNLSTENRVDVLIDDALPDPETGGTTVTVEYTIPSLSIGSYEYCKLVAKKNSIPEGPEDGDKIVDVNPSLTSIVVRGLDELSTYYFVIFIEDEQGNTASSEPKSCKTGIILLDVADMTDWTPDGDFGWQIAYDSATKENHITGQCNQFWEYYEFPLDVERNKNYTVSLQFKGTNYNYFGLYDTLRILDRWQDATQIQQQDGINYNYVIAESDTHFSNQSNYVDCSVTFNSGNRDKVWLYIGAGYVYTGTWMDLYFKNITVVKNS